MQAEPGGHAARRRFSTQLGGALRMVSPGSKVRAGLERILQAQHGALIVLDIDGIEAVLSGGFNLDTELTEPRLAELAKMDGAIVLSADAERILWVNVQLMPLPEITTQESGTRHRTAERTARQLRTPVIAVSEDMRTITLYSGDEQYRLQSTAALLQRADQALATLSRFRVRLDDLYKNLAHLELHDLVTLDDVTDSLASYEVVRRIAEEVGSYVVELGVDGRLINLQLEELMAGVETEARQLVRDYCRPARSHERCLTALSGLADDELWSTIQMAGVLGLAVGDGESDLCPRGHRMMAKIPRVPPPVADALVRRFGDLPRIRKASIEDLMGVDGVGEARARSIIDGLDRLSDGALA